MPKRRLKVFRAVAGFHDAYVAAPSRQAALKAWGAETDLFSAGIAEEVTDPKLTAVPLHSPGQVVKLKRGTKSEWSRAAKAGKAKRKPAAPAGKERIRKAEIAVKSLRAAQARERSKLESVRRTIERRLAVMSDRHKKAMDRAVDRYERAVSVHSE